MKHPAVVALVAAIFFAGCSDSRWHREFELDESSFDAEAMQMIKDECGLNFPQGVRGLNFRYSPPIDSSFVARIDIPSDSRADLVSQLEKLQNSKIDTSGGPGTEVDWWPPAVDALIIDRNCQQANGGYLRAALADEGGRTILYISHAIH